MKTIVCRHCDMVSQVPSVPPNHFAKCSRCEHPIYKNALCSPPSLLALCISALFVSIPAFYFPLISVHLLGITEDANLLQGALLMADIAPLVTAVVLFCAVIAPTLLVLSITISSACITFNYRPAFLAKNLKFTHILTEWSMLEVYMVSLMVAVFKLMTYSSLYFGSGFWFFIALLVLNMSIISNYSNHVFWEHYLND
ncbi:MAG: paraquat-inducible protein A [Psychromonas sp.]